MSDLQAVIANWIRYTDNPLATARVIIELVRKDSDG